MSPLILKMSVPLPSHIHSLPLRTSIFSYQYVLFQATQSVPAHSTVAWSVHILGVGGVRWGGALDAYVALRWRMWLSRSHYIDQINEGFYAYTQPARQQPAICKQRSRVDTLRLYNALIIWRIIAATGWSKSALVGPNSDTKMMKWTAVIRCLWKQEAQPPQRKSAAAINNRIK